MEPTSKYKTDFPMGAIKFSFTIVGSCVAIIIFAFTNFVTKSDLEAKQRADEKIQEIILNRVETIDSKVDRILENSKRK